MHSGVRKIKKASEPITDILMIAIRSFSVFIIKIPNNLKDEDPIEKLLGSEIYHRPILYNFETPEKFKVQVEIDTSDVLKKEKYIEMEVNKKRKKKIIFKWKITK